MERTIEFDAEFMAHVKLLSIYYRISEVEVMAVATRLGMHVMDALRIVDGVEMDASHVDHAIRSGAHPPSASSAQGEA